MGQCSQLLSDADDNYLLFFGTILERIGLRDVRDAIFDLLRLRPILERIGLRSHVSLGYGLDRHVELAAKLRFCGWHVG